MHGVELSAVGWLTVVVPLASTIVFLVLGKDLSLWRRIFASVHGIAAVSILPLTFVVVKAFPDITEIAGTIFMLLIGGIAGTSIFYAIAVVRTRWFYHLLHVPTIAVIAGGFVLTAFLLSGR